MKIHSIYDNGGETFDRFTVYFKGQDTVNPRNGFRCFLGMSERPFHPQGFGQHGEGMTGKHNGRRITFESLPVDCQTAVLADLN